MPTPAPAAVDSAPATGGTTRDALSVLLAMIALSITLNVVILPFTQVVDPVRRTFGVDDVAFSLLVGAFYAVPSMVMSVLGGWLSDRTSRRRLLAATTLLWTAGGIWSALAPSYEQLAAARVLVAIGAGVKFPLAMTWINDAFAPDRRAKAIGAFFVVLGLGPAIGASIGGVVLQAAEAGRFASLPLVSGVEPWRATLLLLALSNVVVVPWVAFLRDRRPAPATTAQRADASARERFPVLLPAAMVAAAAFLTLADTANLSWLPTVLRRQHHFDAQQTGFAFGVIATLAGLFGPLVGGIAGDAAYRRRGTVGRLWVCAAGAAASAPLLLSYRGDSANVLIASLALSGVLTVLSLSLGYVAIQAVLPPHRRGFGTGLASATTQLFAAAAPTVVALAARAFGPGSASLGEAVAVVTVASFVAAACVYAWTAVRIARPEEPAA